MKRVSSLKRVSIHFNIASAEYNIPELQQRQSVLNLSLLSNSKQSDHAVLELVKSVWEVILNRMKQILCILI